MFVTKLFVHACFQHGAGGAMVIAGTYAGNDGHVLYCGWHIASFIDTDNQWQQSEYSHDFSCVMQGGRDPAPTDRSRGHELLEGEGQKEVGQTTLTGAGTSCLRCCSIGLKRRGLFFPLLPSMRITS